MNAPTKDQSGGHLDLGPGLYVDAAEGEQSYEDADGVNSFPNNPTFLRRRRNCRWLAVVWSARSRKNQGREIGSRRQGNKGEVE